MCKCTALMSFQEGRFFGYFMVQLDSYALSFSQDNAGYFAFHDTEQGFYKKVFTTCKTQEMNNYQSFS